MITNLILVSLDKAPSVLQTIFTVLFFLAILIGSFVLIGMASAAIGAALASVAAFAVTTVKALSLGVAFLAMAKGF